MRWRVGRVGRVEEYGSGGTPQREAASQRRRNSRKIARGREEKLLPRGLEAVMLMC